MATWEKQESELHNNEEGVSCKVWKWGKNGDIDAYNQGRITLRFQNDVVSMVTIEPSQTAVIREIGRHNRKSLNQLKKIGVLKSIDPPQYSDLFQSMFEIIHPEELEKIRSLAESVNPELLNKKDSSFKVLEKHEQSLAFLQSEYSEAVRKKDIKRLNHLNKLLEFSSKMPFLLCCTISVFGEISINERSKYLGPRWDALRTILEYLVKDKVDLPYKSEIRQAWVNRYLDNDRIHKSVQTLAQNMRPSCNNHYSNVCKPLTDLLKRLGLDWLPSENDSRRS